MLGPLVALQWIAVAAFALAIPHNGWLFYQGGDETFYYTTSWLLSNGHIPTTNVGYGWSYLLSPIALFTGPNPLAALPASVLLQFLVLLPVALLSVYGIAARIGGRLLGYGAAALWIAIPFLAIPLFDTRYHDKYAEQFLPQALGFSILADYPSMVCLLVSAYFAFRALDTGERTDALASGLAAGFAIGIKPANGLFLAAPLIALPLARRWRQLVPFALALLPALVTLALWKERGLGRLPAFAASEYRLAAGWAAQAPAASLFDPLTRYLHLDWGRLGQNKTGLREAFWSLRLLEWLSLAGVLALARRSFAKAAFVAAWLGVFLVFKGTNEASSVDSGSFFRLMMPAFPSFFLLVVSIPLLVPTFGHRLAQRFPVLRASGRRRTAPLAAGIAVFALVPLVLVAAVRPAREPPRAVKYFDEGLLLPIGSGFRVEASSTLAGQRLAWAEPRTASTRVFYRVFRSRAFETLPDPTAPSAREGLRCLTREAAPGATDCSLLMTLIGTTRNTSWLDRPPPGKWTYRVGVAANWIDDTNFGDVLMLSSPVTVSVR